VFFSLAELMFIMFMEKMALRMYGSFKINKERVEKTLALGSYKLVKLFLSIFQQSLYGTSTMNKRLQDEKQKFTKRSVDKILRAAFGLFLGKVNLPAIGKRLRKEEVMKNGSILFRRLTFLFGISMAFIALLVISVPANAQVLINSGWTATPPTIDGMLSPSTEWADAESHAFSVALPGGTNVPAVLHVMNDGDNLYIAIGIPDHYYSGTKIAYVHFDNDNDGGGDDGLQSQSGRYSWF